MLSTRLLVAFLPPKIPLRIRRRRLSGRAASVMGIVGRPQFGGGAVREQITVFRGRGNKRLVVLGIKEANINIPQYLGCWSLVMKLTTNRPNPVEGRTLFGEIRIDPHLCNYPQKTTITWNETFEQPLYGGLDLNPKGEFIFPGMDPKTKLGPLVSTCDPPAMSNRVELGSVIFWLYQSISQTPLDSKTILRNLEGNLDMYLLDFPQGHVLKWTREYFQSMKSSNADLTKLQAEIIRLLRLELALVEGFIRLVIQPFLDCPFTVNKHLADGMLKYGRELKDLTSDASGETFETRLMRIELVHWKKTMYWIIMSNPDFFKQHLDGILGTKDRELRALVGLSRSAPAKIDPFLEKIISEQIIKTTQREAGQLSNYLYKADSPLSQIDGQTLVTYLSDSFTICGDICVCIEEKTLVMWKTTTAEDRARGKVYLRGFVKEDPVEDRLEV